jgi:hypothetical protein
MRGPLSSRYLFIPLVLILFYFFPPFFFLQALFFSWAPFRVPEALEAYAAAEGIRSDEGLSELDPRTDKAFIVSVRVRFDQLPAGKARNIILSKYDRRERVGERGWALSLRRFDTSLRPEIFWRGNDGGDWYIFDEVSLALKNWYAFTIVSERGNYLSLYIQNLGAAGTENGDVRFLGGYDVSGFSPPSSGARPVSGDSRSNALMLQGALADVLIAAPEDLPEDMRGFLNGGPAEIAGKFPEDRINLWVENGGRDKSRFKREESFLRAR